jgi:molybdate transport system substrate-binding protein
LNEAPAYQVPAAETPDISYPMAVMKETRQLEAAKRFNEYLSSNDAGEVFEKFGFILRK